MGFFYCVFYFSNLRKLVLVADLHQTRQGCFIFQLQVANIASLMIKHVWLEVTLCVIPLLAWSGLVPGVVVELSLVFGLVLAKPFSTAFFT